MLGALSFYHSQTPTLLLGETHAGLTTLCGTHFKSVVLTWISTNKRVGVRESVRECPEHSPYSIS
jgi:hypothetical protein